MDTTELEQEVEVDVDVDPEISVVASEDDEIVRDDELLFDDISEPTALLLNAGWNKLEDPVADEQPAPIRSKRRRVRGVVLTGQLLVGKYRVARVVSVNGVTALVEVRHREVRQHMLLKYLLPAACAYPDAVARFLRGARAALRINSEHAVRVTDVGRLESGAPYCVMEAVRGWDFSEVLRVRGPLPTSDAVDYVIQACEAVAEAHELGIAHRNLNMSSLFLTRRADGSPLVKVLDFGAGESLAVDAFGPGGLGRLTTKAISQLLAYMSPEQIRGASDVDGRTDVWALGAILYELLADSPLFRADTAPALMAMIAADPAIPIRALRPDVWPELETVILNCLEKDRNLRYPHVAELALALKPFASPQVQASIDRISRMVGRSNRPPPLPLSGPPLPLSTQAITHVRALAPVPPPAAFDKRLRPKKALVPIAIAVGGILCGAVLGGIVVFQATRAVARASTPLAPNVFAAKPAETKVIPATPAAVTSPTAAPATPTATATAPALRPALATPERSFKRALPRDERDEDEWQPRRSRQEEKPTRAAKTAESRTAAASSESGDDPFGDVR